MGTFSTVIGRLLIFFIVTASTLGKAADERTLQARLTPCELIKYHGYPCELSYATTDDGYLLEVDHVPYGREGSPSGVGDKRTPRYPVLLVPAFTSASDMWFLNYPSQSPGFLLADRGFDVWSMNSREAKPYSNHTTLSQRDSKYWRWSFDEIGRYDVAAGVDHVLKATGAPKLTIMALSQGVTITLVFLSTRPEYNEKVDLVIAYGPVVNITHAGLPLSVAMPLLPPVLFALDPLCRGAYIGVSGGMKRFFSKICEAATGRLCSPAFTLTLLSSSRQLNKTRIPVYVGHFPMGTTVQNMRHYHQMYKAKNFVMYDHGVTENRRRYGQVPCDRWEYDKNQSKLSIVAEWDLVCQRKRLKQVLLFESTPSGPRATFMAASVSLATALSPVFVVAVREMSSTWRMMHAMLLVPALLLTFLVCIIEESPHWCLYNNMFDDAERIAMWAARLNLEDPDLVRDRLDRIRKDAESHGDGAAFRSARLLRYITSVHMRSRCFALFGCWFFVYIAYYARDYENLAPWVGDFICTIRSSHSVHSWLCSNTRRRRLNRLARGTVAILSTVPVLTKPAKTTNSRRQHRDQKRCGILCRQKKMSAEPTAWKLDGSVVF